MAANVAGSFDAEVRSTQSWMASPRFEGMTRLYSARQVVEQRGAIDQDYTVARVAAERFYARLRELFEQGQCVSTFGPYSPGQAVAMKRAGIEGIYLGGWATSAKGSLHEDPGPDLASYPLSMVPDEAAGLVRALLTADRNQRFARSRMSIEERMRTPEVDFTPSIIADADTGHGGDAHVRKSDPALRGGWRSRLPHRGPKARGQEVRAPGRQGIGAVRRADQAAQCDPIPARRDGRAGHHRGPHRRRGGQPAGRRHRRARPALHHGRNPAVGAVLQGRLPGGLAPLG